MGWWLMEACQKLPDHLLRAGEAMTIENNNHLMELSHLDTMLAQATKIDEIIDLRAKFEAMRIYHVNIKESRERCNEYALARVRAERKVGKVLLSLDMSGNNGGCNDVTTLSDFGVNKSTSHRWQTIARIPNELFEELSLGQLESGDEITTNFFYKAARIHQMRMKGINTDKPHAPLEDNSAGQWIELQYTGGHAVVLPGVDRGQTVVIKYAIVEVIESEEQSTNDETENNI
jgi:hypothetical protein